MALIRKLSFGAAITVLVSAAAGAQQTDPLSALVSQVAAPQIAERPNLSQAEQTAMTSALAAARAGDRGRFDAAFSQLADIDARRLATWAMIDVRGEDMSFFELDQARRDLAGWPREARRMNLTEQKLETANLSPQEVIAWFGGARPATGQGAMALIGAYQAMGQEADARALAGLSWRTLVFEADVQDRFLSRFGAWLNENDHVTRTNMLLFGPQGPAARAMLPLLPPDQRALAEARIALRNGGSTSIDRVPANLRSDGGLIFERVSRARRGGDNALAFSLASGLPPGTGYEDGDQRLWTERRSLFVAALQARNYRAAYDAMNNNGFSRGVRKAESDFFAGWVALTKLGNPDAALIHFEGVKQAGTTPLTQGRALYWLGRAAEAKGDEAAAQAYYQEGSQYIGAFYGQLAAEKAGITTLTLPAEPVPTGADIARFEGRPVVRAARILGQIGEKPLFNAFIGHIDDNLPTAEEYALLMDMTRSYGEDFTAMMAGRGAAGRGFLLPERMYPVLTPPDVPGAPEAAFVLAITRQESSFDPKIRSSADARGMMMLLPSTARGVAQRMGVAWREAGLYELDYNMRLGTYHLGELMRQQSGSMILTAVGYNAGPARPPQWIPYCGDPRTPSVDPLDFIECVPFTETRDYIMRVMENVQVYRARLNGGTAPLTPSADLKRGAYGMVATN